MERLLEEIIVKYKSLLSNKEPDTNPELEIRFLQVGFKDFSIIYEYLLTETKDANDIKLTQMISSIMKQKIDGHNSISKIRNIYFVNKESYKKEYCSKQQVLIPYDDKNQFGISYRVSLSLEKNNILSFISDETALIRLKNRVSFIFNKDGIKWRIDMTIVKELPGNQLHLLQNHVNIMFKKQDVTPDNLLSLFNDNNTSQKTYRYEIEAELINSPLIKAIDILNMAKTIIFIAKPDYIEDTTLQSKIYEIATFITKVPGKLQNYQLKAGLRQLLPKVQALTRCDYNSIYPMNGYYVTDKANGERAIGMQSSDGTGYIISTSLIKYKTIDNSGKCTIVDAELIDDVLYVFDTIVVNGVDVSNLSFENRKLTFNEAKRILTDLGLKVVIKPYEQIIDSIQGPVERIYNRDRPYDIDGLIFVKPGDSYINTKTYKWKNIEENTIDFLVKRIPKSQIGKKPFLPKKDHTIYFLFVGIAYNMYESLGLKVCPGYNEIFEDKINSNSTYFPIQFSPSNAPLAYIYYHPDDSIVNINNKIVEFRCFGNCDATKGPLIEWKLVRIRDDRKKDLESKIYYGNDYRIAEITWINYLDQFPLEQLWLNISDEYFSANKSGIYQAQTSVMSFVKTNRIMSYRHSNWIIDIGCGRGADLGRYFNAKVKNLIGIDSDKSALSELIRRKYILTQNKNDYSTNIYIILADMKADKEILLGKIYDSTNTELKVDNIICNLSFHYYTYTSELLTNFIEFINALIKVGGHVVITCFFGKAVFEKLKNLKEGQSWDKYEEQVMKYSIKKLYSSDSLEISGQKIGVIHPFSKGHYYEEYLVNTDYVIKEFTKNNFIFENSQSHSISKYIQDFKSRNPAMGIKLTKDDEEYLSLYGELVFRKKTN